MKCVQKVLMVCVVSLHKHIKRIAKEMTLCMCE